MKGQTAWRRSATTKAHRDVGRFCPTCSRPRPESACGYPLSGYQPVPLGSISPHDRCKRCWPADDKATR